MAGGVIRISAKTNDRAQIFQYPIEQNQPIARPAMARLLPHFYFTGLQKVIRTGEAIWKLRYK
jgi:hypothetical protein